MKLGFDIILNVSLWQARAIQELARKKFDKLKADEIKSVQKTRSASITEKPVKKHLVSVQEHVVSDFSSGATVAAPKDACASSNVSQDGGVEKLVNGNIIAPSADGNCVATEKQMDKMEDAVGMKMLVFLPVRSLDIESFQLWHNCCHRMESSGNLHREDFYLHHMSCAFRLARVILGIITALILRVGISVL